MSDVFRPSPDARPSLQTRSMDLRCVRCGFTQTVPLQSWDSWQGKRAEESRIQEEAEMNGWFFRMGPKAEKLCPRCHDAMRAMRWTT